MKIEKISDNQIRCTLNRADLQSREIKISELAYGTDKAKDLFHDMIEQASNQFGFQADDLPLMIEAIPVSADCIVLIITKVDDPEELDTRFSKFAPSDDEAINASNDDDLLGLDDIFADGAERDRGQFEGLDGTFIPPSDNKEPTENPPENALGKTVADIVSDTFVPFAEALQSAVENSKSRPESSALPESSAQPSFRSYAQENHEPAADAKTDLTPVTRIFAFDSWDQAAYAAAHLNASFSGDAKFFKNPKDGIYYLCIRGRSDTDNRFFAVSNELTEYGRKVKTTYAFTAFLSEHCQLLVRENALDILKTY